MRRPSQAQKLMTLHHEHSFIYGDNIMLIIMQFLYAACSKLIKILQEGCCGGLVWLQLHSTW